MKELPDFIEYIENDQFVELLVYTDDIQDAGQYTLTVVEQSILTDKEV